MALYKLYRFAVAPDYSDNLDDAEGYLKIVRECVGDNMVHARSADEYQAKKEARLNPPSKEDPKPFSRLFKETFPRVYKGTPPRVYEFWDVKDEYAEYLQTIYNSLRREQEGPEPKDPEPKDPGPTEPCSICGEWDCLAPYYGVK